MKRLDMTSLASSICIMLLLDLVFLCATIYAFHCGTAPSEFKTLMASAFSGWNGALALALTGSARGKGRAQDEPEEK
jgi:hypothetical protein